MFDDENFTVPLDKQTPESIALREILEKAVRKIPADALLLSGGIDSSMLAALDPGPLAITVGLEGRSDDLLRAQKVTQYLGMRWHSIELTRGEAKSKVREIIWHTKSYDPAILNDIPTYTGMKHASATCGKRVRNGEFADTLFSGYSYLQEVSDFETYLQALLPNIILSTTRIGDALGMQTIHPYLESEVISFVRQLKQNVNIAQVETDIAGDHADTLKEVEGKIEGIQRWTKILLRRSALGLLPMDIVYRQKSDLEFGSGMNDVSQDFAGEISDRNFELLKKEKRFWNKMHARFYEIFKELGLSVIPPSNENEYPCTWCGAGVIKGRCHCLTCGGYKSNEQ